MDAAASAITIRKVAVEAGLTPPAVGRAVQIVVDSTPPPGPPGETPPSDPPTRREWAGFLSIAALAAGAVLSLAGIICFFAYNWANIGKLAKFGLIEAGIAGLFLAGWKLFPRISGKTALTGAGVLVGPLLAVYGQTYQTGADPYELFGGWALLILPWALAAEFEAMWLVELLVANTFLVLFWNQAMGGPRNDAYLHLFPALFLLNGAALAARELLQRAGVPWISGRWLARILSLMALAPLAIPSAALIIGRHSALSAGSVSLALVAILSVSLIHHFDRTRQDIFPLAVQAAIVLFLVAVGVGRVVLDAGSAGFLVMAVFIIAEVAGAVWWLRQKHSLIGEDK